MTLPQSTMAGIHATEYLTNFSRNESDTTSGSVRTPSLASSLESVLHSIHNFQQGNSPFAAPETVVRKPGSIYVTRPQYFGPVDPASAQTMIFAASSQLEHLTPHPVPAMSIVSGIIGSSRRGTGERITDWSEFRNAANTNLMNWIPAYYLSSALMN